MRTFSCWNVFITTYKEMSDRKALSVAGKCTGIIWDLVYYTLCVDIRDIWFSFREWERSIVLFVMNTFFCYIFTNPYAQKKNNPYHRSEKTPRRSFVSFQCPYTQYNVDFITYFKWMLEIHVLIASCEWVWLMTCINTFWCGMSVKYLLSLLVSDHLIIKYLLYNFLASNSCLLSFRCSSFWPSSKVTHSCFLFV
jgi:hypothetical protein